MIAMEVQSPDPPSVHPVYGLRVSVVAPAPSGLTSPSSSPEVPSHVHLLIAGAGKYHRNSSKNCSNCTADQCLQLLRFPFTDTL